MKKGLFILPLLVIFMVVGCSMSKIGPSMTPLEIQTMQTRQYEESSVDIVFRSTVSVLQDLGYTITSADKNTGFITAESLAASGSALMEFITGRTEVSQTKATAFVEEIGEVTKIRINFVATYKESSSYGQDDRTDVAVLDVKVYETAFEKIENAMFIRKSTN